MLKHASSARGASALKIVGFGCLGIVVVGLIIVGIVAYNAKSIMRSIGSKAMESVTQVILSESKLPQQEIDSIQAPIRALAVQLREGKITADQMQAVLTEVMATSVTAPVIGRICEAKYIQVSNLSTAEKDAAIQDLHRFVQGVMDGKIQDAKAREAFAFIMQPKEGNRQSSLLKPTLTPEELNSSIQFLRKTSDEAAIPAREYKVDLPKQVQKAIDRGLARKSSLVPTPTESIPAVQATPPSAGVTSSTAPEAMASPK